MFLFARSRGFELQTCRRCRCCRYAVFVHIDPLFDGLLVVFESDSGGASVGASSNVAGLSCVVEFRAFRDFVARQRSFNSCFRLGYVPTLSMLMALLGNVVVC